MKSKVNVLFVCSMNQWRSPTAERIYADHDLVNPRSRGTSKQAARTISARDLEWADVIMVMENKHRQQLATRFAAQLKTANLHVLDIPDEYQFMDPELIQIIQHTVDAILAHGKPSACSDSS